MAKRPSQVDLEKVAEKARRSNTELAGYLASGQVDADRFGERFEKILVNRHSQAATLGRKRGGDMHADETADREFGEAVVEEERPYIANFVQAIRDGKYTGEDGGIDAEAVTKRMDLYVGKLQSSANEAMTLASDPDLLIHWVLGAAERHCSQCPSLAQNGPYRAGDLNIYPGDGTQECSLGCKCSLKREDGLASFGAV